MTPDQIRKIDISAIVSPTNALLREIAAQLAELNENLKRRPDNGQEEI